MGKVGYCVHESKVVDTFTMTRWYGCRKFGGRCEKRGCKDFERERRVAFRLPAKAAGEEAASSSPIQSSPSGTSVTQPCAGVN